MKKLYRKGKVHPSPPPPISDHLALLPATILTLTAALSPEDKQVLAYLISCSAASPNRKPTQKTSVSAGGGGADHQPIFNCDCFRCYMSYWARWDTSPNRQLIHEIIDAYEDGLFQEKKKKTKGAKTKRSDSKIKNRAAQELNDDSGFGKEGESGELESVEASCGGGGGGEEGSCGEVGGGEGEMGLEKGSVRGLVSFIGERFWGVWSKWKLGDDKIVGLA